MKQLGQLFYTAAAQLFCTVAAKLFDTAGGKLFIAPNRTICDYGKNIAFLLRKAIQCWKSFDFSNNRRQICHVARAFWASTVTVSLGTRVKNPVACVAETWADVMIFVQAAVDHARVDFDVRMLVAKFLDPFRSSNDTKHLDVRDAPLFKCFDGHAGGATGRQHWIKHKRDVDGARWR